MLNINIYVSSTTTTITTNVSHNQYFTSDEAKRNFMLNQCAYKR
ncbi:hypothetical protein FF38_10809 [Lucilia cuprina]|uniref:Uncharacterized protein n=1 Tax=Lucilia cuprina TaxID=7375 RepID=A0A0L0CKN3_LUCCU|nr:hypothetical protein FF38_10809 [Lucilia cuprina]